MAKPTNAVRKAVYARDLGRCARCGGEPPTFQHRANDGMGGSPILPTVIEGLVLCGPCNTGAEHELQTEALVHGWKVKKWVRDAGEVPVFYAREGIWCVLIFESRQQISEAEAVAMMHAVYGQEQYEKWGLAA